MIMAGPDVSIESTGNLILQAGELVVLENGFSVESGGRLSVTVSKTFPGS
jgi:hypothetical protein